MFFTALGIGIPAAALLGIVYLLTNEEEDEITKFYRTYRFSKKDDKKHILEFLNITKDNVNDNPLLIDLSTFMNEFNNKDIKPDFFVDRDSFNKLVARSKEFKNNEISKRMEETGFV